MISTTVRSAGPIRIFLLTPLLFFGVTARSFPQSTTPWSLGLAGGGYGSTGSPWSAAENPSVGSTRCIGLVTGTDGSFSSGRISEALSLFSTPLAETWTLRVGLAGASWGPWDEFDASVGAAGTFGRIDAGVRLHAVGTSIRSYGSTVVPRLDVGLRVPLDSSLSLGLALRNITGVKLARRPLPQRAGLGLSWKPDGSSELLLDVEADPTAGTAISLGLVQQVFEPIDLRAGLRTAPITVGFGCGITLDQISIDYGASFRPETGMVHGVGGGFSW